MKFVRYVGAEQCVDSEYQEAIQNGHHVLIDWVSANANSTVDFKLDGKPLDANLMGTTKDFLDIGILVYLADEMVDRSQTTDYWTRRIRCLAPVNDPDNWHGNERLLKDSLAKLSGDLWQFEWLNLETPPVTRRHRRALPNDCDVVCLFSGGTDSLLGAIHLLEEGRKVLLVGHQAEGQSASAQTALADMLRRIYPHQLYLVQCRISRSPRQNTQFHLAKKTERSHRPRSFLFLTLSVAIAVRCGIDEVYMPENGFMALNIPIQMSRTGTLSTRTAHPSYILRFIQVAHEAAGFAGRIRNPFLTQSKTDMMMNIRTSWHPMIQRSISCARPARFNNMNVRHCGYCIPCIHRRIALLESQLDTASHYAFDVFRHFPSLDRDKQQDFRAIVRFALQVNSASTAKLQILILSHGYFPPDIGETIGLSVTGSYDPWIGMLRRWATDFICKVQNTASARTRRAIEF
jgi:7-cyano-7-deazaguanine synthase in queuosine biosynthesis